MPWAICKTYNPGSLCYATLTMRPIVLAVLLSVFLRIPESSATVAYLTFQPTSVQALIAAGDYTPLAKNYVVQADFALPPSGNLLGTGVLLSGNYLHSPPETPIAGLSYWTTYSQNMDLVWGSSQPGYGPYGSTAYRTRFSIFAQGTESISIDGFWQDQVQYVDINSLLTPGALWSIHDATSWPNGAERSVTYWARLVDISSNNPLQRLPEPSSIALLVLGLAVIVWANFRRGIRQAQSSNLSCNTPMGLV